MNSCQICKHTDDSTSYFSLKKCSHKFCQECLCAYIEANIKSKIKCPVNICVGFIPDKIIRKCLSNINIKRYEQICVNFSNPRARKCLTANCPMMKVVENDNAIYHCEYCDQPNCLKCKKRHYPNQCGLNISEETINLAAAEAIKKRKQEELKELGDASSIPNPEKFECSICTSFVLPREGLITRNCHHCFCKNCFQGAMNSIKSIAEYKCALCEQELNPQEINEFVDFKTLCDINCQFIAPKMYCCKYPNCNGMWDRNNCKGSFSCPVCKHVNCMECDFIHENESCNTFRKCAKYLETEKTKKKIKGDGGFNCLCGARIIIVPGGCGAIYCINCKRHVCQFTGKLVGNKGPDYCGCTTENVCHKDCLYGCIPEDH